LEDLDFADDLALKYIHTHPDNIQSTIDCLNKNGKGTCLFISTKKSKFMRINAKNTNVVVVDGQDIEDMNGFDYLGSGSGSR